MRQVASIILILILFTACPKKSTNPEPNIYVSLAPQTLTLNTGETGAMSINLEVFGESIFAVSLQLTYDSSIVSFSTADGLELGDFFGSDIISLLEADENIIHLALTLTQGQTEQSGSGVLGTLRFRGASQGSSPIVITPTELHFYNSAGTEVINPNLDIETGSITVQ